VVLDGDLHSVDVAPDSAVWSAVPKGDRPEWVVQKLTELGVGTIGFVECARSVVRWDAARAARQLERWQRVAREASMQSRRVWLPHVVGVRPFAALDLSTIALADPDGDDGLQGCRGVVVGPEGGFTPAELAAATRCVSLGDTVLRVETAAVVAGVLLTRH
jgi:16S rRNA (uracil1498-N3)-methyltransferase